jgi:hypothetical protein
MDEFLPPQGSTCSDDNLQYDADIEALLEEGAEGKPKH